jgi:hypothetical protein
MSNDRDNRTEDALRRALSAEAQGVSPAGDGLAKIQRRVVAHESRMRWFRPALAGSAAVVVIIAGVGGYAIAHRGSGTAIVKVAGGHSSSPATPVHHHSTTGVSTFFGVQGGKLMQFNATTGAEVGEVSGADADGPVTEVHQVGSMLYFTAGPANCAPAIYSMPAEGGTPVVAVSAVDGYGITGFAISADGVKYAFFANGCGSSAGKGELVTGTLSGTEGISIAFPSLPPVIEGDPVWESDGIHVDAFVKTGMEGYLARYDSSAGPNQNVAPNTNACPGFNIDGGLPNAIAMGPGGVLWVASQTGTSMQVVSCTGTKPTTEFTVQGNDTPQSLSVNAPGDALLTGGGGKVWKWTGTGNAAQLPSATGVTSVTW